MQELLNVIQCAGYNEAKVWMNHPSFQAEYQDAGRNEFYDDFSFDLAEASVGESLYSMADAIEGYEDAGSFSPLIEAYKNGAIMAFQEQIDAFEAENDE